ncbi:MAG: TonB-dependent receptor plug domain-containing protein [Bacteroidota bacterium]
MKWNKWLGCMLVAAAFCVPVLAQEQAPEEDLYTLSLEELMNVPIKSASKKDETLFDAPLSSYTITRADIDKAGSTSIMEALRLAPGVIVREQANGVYDIHIRGFDNILRYSGGTFTKSNFITLVMIDNRPVFNHNLGGTFWESLPVDLNDVERIEIVRGPSAPLFGPNAVSGVINIITTRVKENTLVDISVQGGSPSTILANGSFAKKINDQFSFGISANMQNRERFDEEYFSISQQQFTTIENIYGSSAATFYPNPKNALNKWGANGYLVYAPSENMSFDLSFGTQDDETQKIFINTTSNGVSTGTFFSTNRTDSRYANLAAKIADLSIRTSWLGGTDDLTVGSNPSRYDYTNIDLNAEYGIKIGNHTITPGFNFQNVDFTDEKYSVDQGSNNGFLNASRSIRTLAGFLRTDFSITDKWRLLAAVRADNFSTPDVTRIAYEFATTYKINDNNLIRAAVTRSNSGSFIGNNYLNVTTPTSVQQGNEDLELLTIQMYELGYRVKLSKSLQLDIDVFHQAADNFSAIQIAGVVPPGIPMLQFQDIPTTAEQIGATLSLNFVPSEKLQVKPFLTFQKTETENLPESYVSPSVNPALQYISNEHKNTPSMYAGYFVNYKVASKFNFNLNGYYFAAHNQYAAIDKDGVSEQGRVDAKLLFNVKANYTLIEGLNVFVNARNAFNSDTREFFAADQVGGLYLVGASFNLR